MTKFDKKNGGFTVIEMLVVLGVSAILSTMFIGYGSGLRGQLEVIQEEAKLIQTILRAKTFSIQALANEEGVVACGYGVHIDNNNQEYFIFRKEKEMQDCDSRSDESYRWALPSEIVGERKKFDNKIIFDGGSSNIVDVVFLPPKPDVKLLGTSLVDRGEYVLCSKYNDFCRKVMINKVGQVDSGSIDE